jgi:hypothetical protein
MFILYPGEIAKPQYDATMILDGFQARIIADNLQEAIDELLDMDVPEDYKIVISVKLVDLPAGMKPPFEKDFQVISFQIIGMIGKE